MHDCGGFTKFNGAEYRLDPTTGMPRSKMTKTGAFARYFFPKEAKRIEEIRKRDFAMKKALATARKPADEAKTQAEADASDAKASNEGGAAAGDAAKAKEYTMAEQAGEKGGEDSKKTSSDGHDCAGDAASTKQPDAAGRDCVGGKEGTMKEAGGDAVSAEAEVAKNPR